MARQSDSQCNCVLKCYTILKNFKGKICQETFANEEKNFKYHLMQHESAEECNRKSRECKKQHNLKFNECTKVRNICNKSLNELRVLIKHMKVKHPEDSRKYKK